MLANEYDEWNKAKKEFSNLMQNLTHINMFLLGLGVPFRQPSYILGRPPEFVVPNSIKEGAGHGSGDNRQSAGGVGGSSGGASMDKRRKESE